MRRHIHLMLLLAVALAPACKKGEDKGAASNEATKTKETGETKGSPEVPDKPDQPAGDPGAAGNVAAAAAAGSPVEAAGVEAGGIERDADEGPAAVLTAAAGTVELRRLGEAEFEAAKAGDALYPGDQLRTAEGGAATLTMVDESVVEVAEASLIAIATREGSDDPASGAAVLAGLARFTVTARAPGEGAFRVYTPSGVVLTRGTVYGVGVAASGEVRIGVEAGTVLLLGLLGLDADPVRVDGGSAAVVAAEGTVAAPAPWTTDDWGAWRDEADARVELAAAVELHTRTLGALMAQLSAAYADLEASAAAYAEFEAKAATAAEADAAADYAAAAPEGAASIDASFALAGSIEALTWAYAGRAALAGEIYARHPDTVGPRWEVVEPHHRAAVLWPKRFAVTSVTYLEPLRVQYYVHHPRGRARAELVGVPVPAFYAAVEPPEVEEVKVRGRFETRVWARPEVVVKPQPRPVWIGAPRADWKVKVKVKPAPPRAKVGWYVRPPQVRGSAILGVDARARVTPAVAVRPPEPRAKVRAHVKVQPPGVRIRVGAPDLDAAAKARVKVKTGPGGVMIRDHRGGGVKVRDHGAGDVSIKGAGGVDVKVRDHAGGKVDVKVRDHVGGDVKGKVDVKVRDHAPPPPPKPDVKVRDHGGAKGKVEVKTPDVKVKVKGEAKGGVKIGK